MAAPDPTRARLLEAAGEEFAAKGFEAARVRSICERAGANVAAVNYHFGHKEGLYVQAVLEAHRCGTSQYPEPEFGGGDPADELRQFIHHFLSNVAAMSRTDSWHQTLMLREMLRPSEACEALVREAIRPKFERLLGILRRARPAAAADPRRLHALAFSVIGQCLHYRVARPVSERLIGPEAYAELDVDFLTDHITGVCLAALGLGPPLGAGAGAGAGGASNAGGGR